MIIDDQVRARFDEEGVVGPFPLATISDLVLTKVDWASKGLDRNPHLVSEAVRDLLNDQHIQQVCSSLFADNLDVWRTKFFFKKDQSEEIGWHHDKHFHDDALEDIGLSKSPKHWSVLIGLDDIDENSGMIEYLPGSHRDGSVPSRDKRPYHQRPFSDHFITGIEPALLDRRMALLIPKGYFVAFHSALVHRSLAHKGGAPRLGLAIRFAQRPVSYPEALARADDILAYS